MDKQLFKKGWLRRAALAVVALTLLVGSTVIVNAETNSERLTARLNFEIGENYPTDSKGHTIKQCTTAVIYDPIYIYDDTTDTYIYNSDVYGDNEISPTYEEVVKLTNGTYAGSWVGEDWWIAKTKFHRAAVAAVEGNTEAILFSAEPTIKTVKHVTYDTEGYTYEFSDLSAGVYVVSVLGKFDDNARKNIVFSTVIEVYPEDGGESWGIICFEEPDFDYGDQPGLFPSKFPYNFVGVPRCYDEDADAIDPEEPQVKPAVKEVKKDRQGYYYLENEPYHSFSFYKKSAYDKSMLDGAVFHLTGTSDEGTKVDRYAVSGAVRGTIPEWVSKMTDADKKIELTKIFKKFEWDKDDASAVASAIQAAMKDGTYGNTTVDDLDGTVKFDNLEQGTYVLQETEAPTIYWYDYKKNDGTYTTDNYNKDSGKYVVTLSVETDSSGKSTYTSKIDGLTDSDNGIPVMYDTKIADKTVVVKKIWKDGRTDHVPTELAITITTEVPEAATSCYKITFDAGEGTFNNLGNTNKVIYNRDGASVLGTYYLATQDDATIIGWNTEDGTLFDVEEFSGSSLSDETKAKLTAGQDGNTLHAMFLGYSWEFGYAVMLYDIGVDDIWTDINNNGTVESNEISKGGLTFGPAESLNDDYIDIHAAKTTGFHKANGQTSDGNNKRCIGLDSWDTIIEWNKIDPYVYEDCITNNCSRIVPLSLTDDNSGPADVLSEKVFTNDQGVNWYASNLWHGLQEKALAYAKNEPASFGESDTFTWADSNARAMLNGISKNSTDYNETYMFDGYSQKNSLLSAFPNDLQKAIGMKAVKYANSYEGYDSSSKDKSVGVTYDKLWLFSTSEVVDVENSSPYKYSNEGTKYSALPINGIDAYSCEPSFLIRFWLNGSLNEDLLSSEGFWLRSRYGRTSWTQGQGRNVEAVINKYCKLDVSSSTSTQYGVAPGFVLAR